MFGKVDDWINPIVVKELRQAVRSRAVTAALMLFLLLQLLIIGVYALSSEATNRSGDMIEGGRELFQYIQAIMLGTCLLIPAYTGIRLGAERSDTNVDLLFISTLKPRAIVAGKLSASVVLVLLVFSACTPFMTFTYLLRGLDIPTILAILVIDFLAVLWAVQWAIFLAVIPVPLAVRILFILLGLGGLIGLLSSTLGITYELLQFGLGVSMDTWEFWGPVLASGLLVLACVGLLFVWSVAILSPPSANRALRVRLYLAGMWLVTGVVVLWAEAHVRGEGLFIGWVTLLGLLFAQQVLISINERDSWGARVARSIPRHWWLRLPAFLIYSGSAGGVVFSLLMFVLTFFVGFSFMRRHTTGFVPEVLADTLRFLLLLFLYAYCYSMSALLLHRTLLARQLKAVATWLVALLLLGLGSVLPYLAAYFLAPDSLRYGRQDQAWLLTNPFVSIEEAMREGHRRIDPFISRGRASASLGDIVDASVFPFLAVWAALVTLLVLPWFIRQVAQFRPLERSREDRSPPQEAGAEEPEEVLPGTEASEP